MANCWDAGANRVDILWPTCSAPQAIEVKDDGTGMTYDQFTHRWLELNYNRRQMQGEDAEFPPDNQPSHRKAFGRKGKGRHSMFCFASQYSVETWRDGQGNLFKVRRTTGTTRTPYDIAHLAQLPRDGHGTIVSAELVRNYLPLSDVHDLIGSKFVTDPAFRVHLNGELLELTDLAHLIEMQELAIAEVGIIRVSRVDTQRTSKTSHPHGVAWWVNRRLVGEPSWDDFRDSGFVDRRTVEAKRYTFVVEADVLADDVEEDWSGFQDTDRYQAVREAVESHIRERLLDLMRDDRKAHKIAALTENKESLAGLPPEFRYYVGQLLEGLLRKTPAVAQNVLSAAVQVMSSLEKARTGYALLEQLAKLRPDEIDQLHDILEKWTVQEARVVLGELHRRLNIIERLEQLVEDPTSDELHEMQPVFERGLWIFGPEYESVHYTSNRSLITVITGLLEDRLQRPLESPRRRPDFVITPDSTIGIYASAAFDERSEVCGFDKVIIVELKRGGSRITLTERRQAEDYAKDLRKAGKVQNSTKIIAFVLGTEIDDDVAAPLNDGNTTVYAWPYSVVLRQAHARTFYLADEIRKAKQADLVDADVEQVAAAPEQSALFTT